MSLLRVAAVVLAVGACAVDDDDATGTAEQQIIVKNCEDWGCGTNSPEIDQLGIHDLHGVVAGLPNANGFVVTKIEKTPCLGCAPVGYKQIYSDSSFLVVTGPNGTLVGSQVVGTVITVQSGAKLYEIIVQGFARTPMWAHIHGNEQTPTYVLKWDVARPPGEKREWKNICKNLPVTGSPDLLGMSSYDSVVYEDDQIDAKAKTVKTRDIPAGATNSGWFNIGCAGHALAKLHLTGHTIAAKKSFGFNTDEAMRQTALKMITGDYCGTGRAFTVAGQPLGWTDQFGWNQYEPGFTGTREAEWTSSGARCLNTPRVLANPTPLGTATFPDLEQDIKAECRRPPACRLGGIITKNTAYMISANPN